MLPNFIKVFDFLFHALESSFLRATPLVPSHKERNGCKMKRFSHSSRFKTWNSIPVPLKAGISGTKHKSPPIQEDLRWKVHFSDLRSSWQVPAEFPELGFISGGCTAQENPIPWALRGENIGAAEQPCWVWGGNCWDRGVRAGARGWSWQKFT